MDGRLDRLIVSLALAALTVVAYEGVARCGFVDFDDNVLITGEPHLRDGLSWSGISWAFTAVRSSGSRHVDYVSPLTLLSRLLDVQLFGFDPAAHHLVNLLFHAVHVVLAFLVLEALTGGFWPSAFVAALLAVHPLHVESVAWVTERKDVLSGVFWWLTVGAYVRYVRQPGTGRRAAVAILYVMALMAKPMVVTLPFVLLLFDYWPLGRLRPGEPGLASRARQLLAEKAELFGLAVLSAVITHAVFSGGGRLAAFEALPLGSRLANAVHSYGAYVGQFFWPHPLAVHYPYVLHLPVWQVAAAALPVLLWAVAAIRCRRSKPYLLVGLLMFVGMLVPVIGLVQSGDHARADRYMYLPSVGLSMALAWGVADWFASRRRAAALVAGLVLAACALKTHAQVEHWKDSVSLFSYTVAVTRDNFVANTNLGGALAARGDFAGAEQQLREALRIRPGYLTARVTLGSVLTRSGRLEEARASCLETVGLYPDSSEAQFNLGAVNARLGRDAEAAANYAAALRLDPGMAVAHYNWGNLLAAHGRLPEAAAHYTETIRLDPQHIDARSNLGLALGMQGRWDEAVLELRQAVGRSPGHARARVALGRALYETGRLPEAEQELRQALLLAPGSVDARLYLGQCLTALGRRDEARSVLDEAQRRSPGDAEVRAAIARLSQ